MHYFLFMDLDKKYLQSKYKIGVVLLNYYDTKPMMNYKENEKSIASTNFVKDDFC